MQQVFSRTGRHKNIKSWPGVEFQQSVWVRSTQADPAAALPWARLAERPRSGLQEGPPLHHTPSGQGGLRSQEDQLQSGYLLSLLSITAGIGPQTPSPLRMALLPSLLSPLEGKCTLPAERAGFIPATTCTTNQELQNSAVAPQFPIQAAVIPTPDEAALSRRAGPAPTPHPTHAPLPLSSIPFAAKPGHSPLRALPLLSKSR